ncbi:MAG TPA: helix-hairpin-helix domain-containing protein [Bacteroidia bacterium]|nr:helix-hairpin-helix domain-containing protein [Bacteroidia bacterium]
MENYEIADLLKETARLMELHEENSFKIKSYQNASFKLDRLTEKLEGKSVAELEKVDGIGKSLSVKIFELLSTGTFPDLKKLIDQTPPGVIEMMHIKGIGPKKVAIIWKEMGIESPGELLYACNENRLVEVKGFGQKTQETIRQAILFMMASKGYHHYATAEALVWNVLAKAKDKKEIAWDFIGDMRRKCEVIEHIDFILTNEYREEFLKILLSSKEIDGNSIVANETNINLQSASGIKINIDIVSAAEFIFERWKKTGNAKHINDCLAYKQVNESELKDAASENEIYQRLGLAYAEPEMREGIFEIELMKNNSVPVLVTYENLKGILHNHSTNSDGIHSLKEMAEACKKLNMQYLGMCDHSKSAGYANGLSIERVLQQHAEIDELNKAMAPFKIFKGIESDILSDGSLDYPEEILKSFDFIVASVHSGLQMDEEKATQRLIKAIENPYTTILGHPTGRLLLARKGYPINHKAVIDACAANNVVIELNAHPYRLDIDWRWIQYALSKNVMISINPDAHATDGYLDMYYGVCAARKGGLTEEMTFNAKDLEAVTKWFQQKNGIKNS